MTDLDKFKEFFDSVGIKYKVKEFEDKYYLTIDYKYVRHVYGNTVEILFSKNGKFATFLAWGE